MKILQYENFKSIKSSILDNQMILQTNNKEKVVYLHDIFMCDKFI